MSSAQSFSPVTIYRQRIAQINRCPNSPECVLITGAKVTLPLLLASHIAPGDDLSFPLLTSSLTVTTEIYVTKNSLAGSGRDVYQVPIGYVTHPKKDKRDEFFVAAEVHQANFGISSVLIACKLLREYFYRIPQNAGSSDRQTLYDILRMSSAASPGELRLGFKLRQLELETKHAQPRRACSA